MPSNAVTASLAHGSSTVPFIISGIYTGAVVTIEGSLDPIGAAAQTWANLSAINRGTGNLETGNLTPALNTNTNGLYAFCPGIGALNGNFTEIASIHIPKTFRVNMTYAGTPATDKATTFAEGEVIS